MGKKLIVAEKPSVGRDIGRVLGVSSKGDGFIFNERYIISWAIGHLLTLLEPEDYDPALKRWTVESLPIIPKEIRTKPVKKTAAQLRTLVRLMKDNEVSNIICATDSGREGELIFRYIYAHAKCRKPVERLWISSMTDEAIQTGFANLRPMADYDNLYNSARCRSYSDWLVGINASRAYSITTGANLSVGRVQTPTLAMIVDKQAEIDSFVPQDYWEVHAEFLAKNGQYTALWHDNVGAANSRPHSRLNSHEKAKEIAEKVKGKIGKIESIENEQKRTPPPLLHDLADLQREANQRFGFSASKTLSVAQDLYEKRKVITYPRTDSRHLSPDMPLAPVIGGLARNVLYSQYAAYVQSLGKLPITKRIVDASKVSDHHAIIPTGKTANNLTADEAKIFDLVARRFLAVFYPPYVQDITEVLTVVYGENFLSKGVVVVELGWKNLYSENEKNENLPKLAQGEEVKAAKVEVKAKKTQPPKPYTEATLLSAMENAGRTVEDEEIAAHMKQNGLGTAATRAAIIERLLAVGYILRKGKALIPTEKGKVLISILPPEITSAETTGRWEKGLHSINDGRMEPARFMGSIEKFVRYLVDNAKNSGIAAFPKEERTYAKKGNKKAASLGLGKCPLMSCGGGILENSKGYYCGNWKSGCKFTIWKNEMRRYNYELTPQDVAKILSGTRIEIAITLPDTHEKATAQLVLDVESATMLRIVNLVRLKS
ncbi:MAG: DNA topoisomerase III [Defluviitaleaceae bacterium]|nr:DNA topoisomerase III [Defluviitaleaceae bacterium]